MGFLDIGIWEILVILVVIVLVMGPDRLPEMARKIGKTMRAINKVSTDITTGLTREVEADEDQHNPPHGPEQPHLTENLKKTSATNPTPPQDKDHDNSPIEP